MGVFDVFKKKKHEKLKPLFEKPKEFVVSDNTPLTIASKPNKVSKPVNGKDLEDRLSKLIQKKQNLKTLSSIIPKKIHKRDGHRFSQIELIKNSLKKDISEGKKLQEKFEQEKSPSVVGDLKHRKIIVEGVSKTEVEDKKSLKVLEFFLTRLVEELGSKDEIEILKVYRFNDGWKALVKINGDLFSFDLSAIGDIVSFEELESELRV